MTGAIADELLADPRVCVNIETQRGYRNPETVLQELSYVVLQGSDSDFVKPDFPNAEHYWYFDCHREVADDTIFKQLGEMTRAKGG